MLSRDEYAQWLKRAIEGNNERTISIIFEWLAQDNLRDCLTIKDEHGRSYLIFALTVDAFKVAEFFLSALLELKPELVLEQDPLGRSAISYAAEKNNIAIIQKILAVDYAQKNAVALFAPDGEGYTPLHYAITVNAFAVAELLLSTLSELKPKLIFEQDKFGRSPLSYAAEKNTTAIIKKILHIAKAQENPRVLFAPDYAGCTPLHYATRHGQLDAATCLLQESAGSDQAMGTYLTNLVNTHGDTALQYACDTQSPALIALLINYGADMAVQNNQHLTPFQKIVELKQKTQDRIMGLLSEEAKSRLQASYKRHMAMYAYSPQKEFYVSLLAAYPVTFAEQQDNEHDHLRVQEDRNKLSSLINHLSVTIDALQSRPKAPLTNRILAILVPILSWVIFAISEITLVMKINKLSVSETNDASNSSYLWGGWMLNTILSPIMLGISNFYFSRWLWNKGRMASHDEWKAILDNLHSDVIEKLTLLAQQDKSCLPIEEANIKKLQRTSFKLSDNLPVEKAIDYLTRIEKILTDLRAKLNHANRSLDQTTYLSSVGMFPQPKEVIINIETSVKKPTPLNHI